MDTAIKTVETWGDVTPETSIHSPRYTSPQTMTVKPYACFEWRRELTHRVLRWHFHLVDYRMRVQAIVWLRRWGWLGWRLEAPPRQVSETTLVPLVGWRSTQTRLLYIAGHVLCHSDLQRTATNHVTRCVFKSSTSKSCDVSWYIASKWCVMIHSEQVMCHDT